MNEYNILVVEDEKEIADAIGIYLKNQGYNVFKAGNGEEGLKIIKFENVAPAISCKVNLRNASDCIPASTPEFTNPQLIEESETPWWNEVVCANIVSPPIFDKLDIVPIVNT